MSNSSAEKKGLAKVTRTLPDGCSLEYDKRITGKSRKGVVVYYAHFVRARFTDAKGTKVEKTFDYDHHDSSSKVSAYAFAQSWVIGEHKKAQSK